VGCWLLAIGYKLMPTSLFAAAIGLVADLLPQTPSRPQPGPLMARIVMGGLSAACLSVSAGSSVLLGAVVGGIDWRTWSRSASPT